MGESHHCQGTLLEIVIIGCVGNMRNEKFGYIWAILMEGRLVGWLVGACVFYLRRQIAVCGELPSTTAIYPSSCTSGRYASEDFSDPFISPREQGAFVFSFAKMQHRYVDEGGTLSRLPKVILL